MSQTKLRIVVLQSCDEAYAEFLAATLDANAAYAETHGYGYRYVVGTLSPIPHTGNFNRYYLLREELNGGRFDWALWLDADAIVVDQSLPLEAIIERTPDKMLIACQGVLLRDFDVNNGVFLLNLRHGLARTMIDYVIGHCERLDCSERKFRSDQAIMQRWLRTQEDSAGRIPFVQCYQEREYNLMNYDGPFIRHVLRTEGPADKRVEYLRRLAAEVQRRALRQSSAAVR